MPASKSGIWINPKHGTRTGYANYKCRCVLCRAWNATNQRKWTASHRDYTRSKAREYYAAHPEWRRRDTLGKYGLTIEEFSQLVVEQAGKCAICDGSPPVLAVDHDHACCKGQKSCGKCVRGLLCGKCNKGIGLFKENPGRLKRAIEYLSKYTPEEIRNVAD